MKVTIIKGPLFEQQEKLAHEYLYRVISQKVEEEQEKQKEAI